MAMQAAKKESQSSKKVPSNGKKNNFKGKKQLRKDQPKPKKAYAEIEEILSRYAELTDEAKTSQWKVFNDYPLSKRTLDGLEKAGYKEPTEIQRDCISLALRGLDILGAAKTGSGKTLAFVIPVLECLYRNRWSKMDGLGALILSPTRELAYQTFQVLKKVGCNHDFSAALLIGGTDLAFERNRVAGTNIIICTPGRLLQHMDENAAFTCDSLRILVLDEADRILDMGFQQQLNAIIDNLPIERQTLLFSATQTKSVRDLARLSLKDPVYVSVHEHAPHSTPEELVQSYTVCPDEDKINMLWSFLSNHKHKKTIIFMTSCKQVRFVYEAFRHLRPGLTILALHGSMNQMKRMAVYEDFCRKQHAALFATDVAARGLDFPAVDWVVQLDCPCDADEYIHRSGRTARYGRKGEALLILTPSQETPMVAKLHKRNIPIQKISVDPKRMLDIRKKLESELVQFPGLKDFAQKSFIAYLRSIFLMKHKDVFDVASVDFDALARSYGLAIAPRVRFMRKHANKNDNAEPKGETKEKDIDELTNMLLSSAKNRKKAGASPPVSESDDNEGDDDDGGDDDDDDDEESAGEDEEGPSANEDDDGPSSDASDDSDGDILTVRRSDVFNILPTSHGSSHSNEAPEEVHSSKQNDEQSDDNVERNIRSNRRKQKPLTKLSAAKELLKKKKIVNKKMTFGDDDGMPTQKSEEGDDFEKGLDIEKAMAEMKDADKIDRQTFRERRRAVRLEKKRKEREQLEEKRRKRRKQDDEEVEARLPGASDSDAESVDLSWLPDPDRPLGVDDDDDESGVAPKKLREDEDLAMMLLSGKK